MFGRHPPPFILPDHFGECGESQEAHRDASVTRKTMRLIIPFNKRL